MATNRTADPEATTLGGICLANTTQSIKIETTAFFQLNYPDCRLLLDQTQGIERRRERVGDRDLEPKGEVIRILCPLSRICSSTAYSELRAVKINSVLDLLLYRFFA